MAETIRARSDKLFQLARDDMVRQLMNLKAKHSLNGSFGGSPMMNASVRIYESESREALAACLDGVARRVEHRGRKWTKLLDEVAAALDDHIALAPEFLKSQLPPRSQEYFAKVNPPFEPMGDRLRHQLAEFREDWTAPKAKSFRERWPFAYAVLLLLIGALLTMGVQTAKRTVFPDGAHTANGSGSAAIHPTQTH